MEMLGAEIERSLSFVLLTLVMKPVVLQPIDAYWLSLEKFNKES